MEGSIQVSLANWGKGYHLSQQCNSWGKRKKAEGWKVICMACPGQHCHISQDSAVTWVSISWWPDRGNEAHVYNGIILKKNEVMSLGITLKEQELIMLSEASQLQKKCHMMAIIGGIWKDDVTELNTVVFWSDLQCSPKAHVLKAWSPAFVVALLAGKPSIGKSSLQSHTRMRYQDPGCFLFLVNPRPPWSKLFSSIKCS